MDAHEKSPGDIRASDADRDVVAQRLATALSDGRLDMEEYRTRLDAALGAVTVKDLVPLTADLPVGTAPSAPPAPCEGPVDLAVSAPAHQPTFWEEHGEEWRAWAGGAVIMVGIWTVTSVVGGGLTTFWPLIPLGIWAAVLVAGMISGGGKKSGCH